MVVLAACSGDPVANTPETGPVPGQNPGGGTSRSGGSSTLVGTWRIQLVVQVPGNVQTWTTTWRFDADGTCHQTMVTESSAEGVPHARERDCTFTVNGEFSFAGFSSNRLVLDGFEYERLA